jgi:hypothetical protein
MMVWRGAVRGSHFDPNVDYFYQPVFFFGPQPTIQPGNATRYNPKLRNFSSLNESVSLAKDN